MTAEQSTAGGARVSLPEGVARMRADLRADFARNPFPSQRLTLLVWRAGNLLSGRRDPVSRVLRIAQQLANVVWLRGVIGAEIPTSVPIGPGLYLPHSARGCIVHHSVRIGAGCTLYHRVTIGLAADDAEQGPILGDDVYLGAGATVIGAITLAPGTRVGANAVLLRDTEPHVSYVGVPARPVASRRS